METSEQCALDTSIDPDNLTTENENIERYEADSVEQISSQNEDNQDEQVIIEIGGGDSDVPENATMFVLDDGTESSEYVILLQGGHLGDQSFIQNSVIHTDVLQNGIVIDNTAQNIGLFETGEASHEEHIFIERNDRLHSADGEDLCSSNVDENTWEFQKSGSESESVILNSNPSIVSSSVIAPEESKHRKLMQLAYIAHELQSADQKSSNSALVETFKTSESSHIISDSTVIVSQQQVDDSNSVLIISNDKMKMDEDENTELSENTESQQELNANFSLEEGITTNVAPVPCYTLSKTIDNTVSVIHATMPSDDFSTQNDSDRECFPTDSDVSDKIDTEITESDVPTPETNSYDFQKSDNEDVGFECFLKAKVKTSVIDQKVTTCSSPLQSKVSVIDVSDKEGKNVENVCEESERIPVTEEERNTSPVQSDAIGIDLSNKEKKNLESTCESMQQKVGEFETHTIHSEEGKYLHSATDRCSPSAERFDDDITSSAQSSRRNSCELIMEVDESKDEFIDNTAVSKANYSSVDESDEATHIDANSWQSSSYVDKVPDDLDDTDMSDVDKPQDFDKKSENHHITSESNSKKDEGFTEQLPLSTTFDESHKVRENDVGNESDSTLDRCVSKYDENADDHYENTSPSDNLMQEVLESSDMEQDNTDLHRSVSFEDENSANRSTQQDQVVSETYSEGSGFLEEEETFTKPPAKTYIRKRKAPSVDGTDSDKEPIELFSCEDLNNTASNCDNDPDVLEKEQHQETANCNEQVEEEEDLKLCAVSTTYGSSKKRSKIIPPVVREMRTRSLRPRASNSRDSLDGASDSILDTSFQEKDSVDSNNSETIHWGDYLMKTSFISSDKTKTSKTSNLPKSSTTVRKLTTPISRNKQINQSSSNGQEKRKWEKLVKSSPSKLKKFDINKRKLEEKVKRQAMHHLNSKSFHKSSGNYLFHKKRGRPRKSLSSSLFGLGKSNSLRNVSEVKRTDIKYLDRRTKLNMSTSTSGKCDYYCIDCNYATNIVNNIVTHVKFCPTKCSMSNIDYRVDDMDRRQRIRGEDTSDSIQMKEKISPSSSNRISLPDCSRNFNSDSDDEACRNEKSKRRYGFSVDDVVWIKVDDRFWPGLVYELTKNCASVMLVNYPYEKKAIKVTLDRIHYLDDAKWNRMLLSEAEALPHYDDFVKAVQKSETFVRKKWLEMNIKGKEFFGFPDKVDFLTDIDSNDDSNNFAEEEDIEDICSDLEDIPGITAPPVKNPKYEDLDVPQIMQLILEGHCTDHLLGIFSGEIKSQRHAKYFSNNIYDKKALKSMTWFGPLQDYDLQNNLYEFLYDVFVRSMGKKADTVSYVHEVMVPEAIIKAISITKNISLQEAETIFNYDPDDDEDLSFKNIEEAFS